MHTLCLHRKYVYCLPDREDNLGINVISLFNDFSVGRETNSMVEEFMLLANISVAKKIHEEFSEHALLRKHPAPPPSNYEILVKAAKSKVRSHSLQNHLYLCCDLSVVLYYLYLHLQESCVVF